MLDSNSFVDHSAYDAHVHMTTAAHSMEEAEALCDRLGIFVNGELQCIGNAKEVGTKFFTWQLLSAYSSAFKWVLGVSWTINSSSILSQS